MEVNIKTQIWPATLISAKNLPLSIQKHDLLRIAKNIKEQGKKETRKLRHQQIQNIGFHWPT